MEMNLAYWVEQTQLSPRKNLQPLFEAIANSMYAIEEGKPKDGEITIKIIRDTRPKPLTKDVQPTYPVTGFTITDNGIGFTEENYKSFDRAYSDRKKTKGGKGVGRLLWLKSFKRAEIDSTYKAHDGKCYRRTFDFTLSGDGMSKHANVLHSGSAPNSTTVKLIDFLPAYQAKSSPNGKLIASKIIGHFIGHFIQGSCPTIILRDDYEDWSIDLKDDFKQMQLRRKPQRINVEGTPFKIEHLCLAAASHSGHELHLCAIGRNVETEELHHHIPCLRGPLRDENDQLFYYTVCVYGDHFDTNANQTRTKLDLVDERDLMQGEKELTRQAIYRSVVSAADKFLKDYLEPVRVKNTSRIVKYIQQQEPKYRPLAKHRPHWFDRIHPNLPDEALSVELYKLSREYEKETKSTISRIKRKMKYPLTVEATKSKFKQFLCEINDQNIAKLSDYVVHRRAILEFLKESISLLPTGKYAAEKQIHQIVCPLGTTSDDVPLDQMNLWLIDERLTFHRYLSSDRQMKSVKPLKLATDDRADIILFTDAVAFADDPTQSIVIIEFKRPMRDDYTEEENPISQVVRYVEDIREKQELITKDGRPLTVTEATPIYAFMICDATKNLKRFAKQADFKPLPDLQGYVKFHEGFGLHAEIITFNKLLKDAIQRNAAFFDRLGMPQPSLLP